MQEVKMPEWWLYGELEVGDVAYYEIHDVCAKVVAEFTIFCEYQFYYNQGMSPLCQYDLYNSD